MRFDFAFFLNQISIGIIFSPIVIFIISLVILLFSILYYKKTNPELNLTSKVFLSILRFIALTLLVLSFGELTIQKNVFILLQPKVAILIDNSKSILFDSSNARKAYSKLINDLKKNNLQFDTYLFDSNIREISIDSLNQINFDGSNTNISSAIYKINSFKTDKNYSSLILVSDGIYNSGEKPIYAAEKLSIPIITIGVGDPSPKHDISLTNILTNDLIYAENNTKVILTINSNGYNGQITSISFFEDNKLIEKRLVNLLDGTQEIEFNYQPKSDGEKKLHFSISPLKDEYTTKNNFITRFVKVLSNKIRVLTLAAKPNHDLSFINQAISKNKDFRLQTLIEKGNGEFYPNLDNQKFLDSSDVIFFVGFPGSNNSSKFVNEVVQKIKDRNIPLFILIQPETDFTKLSLFKDYIPFDWKNPFGTSSQVFIDVPEVKASNEILKIDPQNSVSAWNSLPPIYKVDREFLPKAESEILAYFKIQNTRINQPLILSRNLNRHRSIALLGFNVWRIKLLNAMRDEQAYYFDAFINNSIKWLTTRELTKNLIIHLNKKIFDVNESVEIFAQLYNRTNEPIDNANIQLSIFSKKEKKFDTQFQPIGSGLYRLQLNPLDKGDYEFMASVEYSGEKYIDRGKFSVVESELEFRDLVMKEDLLKQLANFSNGIYFNAKDIDKFSDRINQIIPNKPTEKKITKIYQIWDSPKLLVILILFFTIEWLTRKSKGLL